MFSVAEKKKIAEKIEKLLLSLDHSEMPKEKPVFLNFMLTAKNHGHGLI